MTVNTNNPEQSKFAVCCKLGPCTITDTSVVKIIMTYTILSRPAGGHESQAAINRKLYTICH